MNIWRSFGVAIIVWLLVVASGAAAAPVELEFTGWEEAVISEILNRFNQEHPHIQIKLVSGGPAQILTRMAAGTGPDVYRVSWGEFTPWMLKGLALDLTRSSSATVTSFGWMRSFPPHLRRSS